MGLIGLLFGWPLAPLRGVIKLGEVIQEEAERQLHDPAVVRRKLEAIEAAMAEGRISEEQAAEQTEQVLQGMIGEPMPEEDGG
ncbi:gas vesicle protein GvpG [Nonomuraea sp. NPDC050536]|uniref:gas vesicle protein GvpG n=1 Tax=Nonomuraea sp. NPDC050536 TaxID=3364366 RepID=UPI0037C65E21